MKLATDLQLFADAITPPEGTTPPEGETKTFTQADMDKLAGEIRAKEKAKFEKELQTKISTVQTEAERLATLSAEEKAEAKRKQHEEALLAREQGITKRELRAEALQQLAEKGLPKELADVLPYVDADATKAAIESVEKVFRAAVDAAVKDQLRANPPKIGSNTGTTPSEIDKLTAEYEAAIKAGKLVESVALKNKIFTLQHEKK